jgi:hypothetical protein
VTQGTAHGWRLHPALDAVVLRALAKEPGRRFRSAEDMGVALQHAAVG